MLHKVILGRSPKNISLLDIQASVRKKGAENQHTKKMCTIIKVAAGF